MTTTGEAEVRVVPDEVLLTVGVETLDPVLASAKARNDEAVRKVHAAAVGAGVESRHIQTEYIDIEPRYRDSYERRDLLGYMARKTMVVTLRDLKRFEALLQAVIDAGANHVLGIEFRTTELRKHRDQARLLATKAAREKAVALSGELGQEVDRPHAIEEEQNHWFSPFRSWWGGSRFAGAQNVIQNAGPASVSLEDTIAPGQIAVSARVKVKFELK